MKIIEILEQKKNEIIPREEIILLINHDNESQPKRYELREKASAKLKTKIENTIVRKIKTLFGRTESKAIIHVYKNEKELNKYEPEYLKKRNQPKKLEKTNTKPEQNTQEKKEETKKEQPKKVVMNG